jgi:hypothetical protein
MDHAESPDHCQCPLYLSHQRCFLKFKVALALVFLGHEEQGVLLMGGAGKKCLSCFLNCTLARCMSKSSSHNYGFLVPSRSLGPQNEKKFFTFRPLLQFFNTNRAHLMRSPGFTLIYKFHAKVCVVDFFLQILWYLSVVFLITKSQQM